MLSARLYTTQFEQQKFPTKKAIFTFSPNIFYPFFKILIGIEGIEKNVKILTFIELGIKSYESGQF